MPLPEATIQHSSPGRIRIRVPERRGDSAYFTSLAEQLSLFEKIEGLEVNPLTAGVLVIGADLTEDILADLGRKENLFSLKQLPAPLLEPAKAMAAQIDRLNQKVRDFTSGSLELPTLVFLGLLLNGFFQLLRGGFRSPPWYTAFWYAFGLYGKTLMDRSKDKP